jgi:hypothetical protein
VQKVIDRGDLVVEETSAGTRITEASITQFDRERREKKPRVLLKGCGY